MKAKKLFLSIACLLIVTTGTQAQQSKMDETYPVVGEKMPDFTLNNVNYYPKKQVSLNDFAGKWLVLDFWSRGCTSCINSFPKMNKLQADLKDKMQLVMVGVNSSMWGVGIEPLYEKLKKSYNLDMTVAYDSLLAKSWGVRSLPHVIIIDDKGIVRAITVSFDKTDFLNLRAGKENNIMVKKNAFEEAATPRAIRWDEPFLINNNVSHDMDFEYRSVLSKYDNSIDGMSRGFAADIDIFLKQQKFFGDKAQWQGVGLDITQLYRLAYAGQAESFFNNYMGQPEPLYNTFYKKLILEVKDSTSFQPVKHEGKTVTGLYNYSLIMPKDKATRESMMWQVQCDLKKYFGYDATVETRLLPYYKLVATDEARKKLKTKGGVPGSKGSGDGFTGYYYINTPISHLLETIAASSKDNVHAFIDETGIEGNIDLNLDAIFNDYEAVKRVLRKNGLDIVLARKPMQCIVIRDRTSIFK